MARSKDATTFINSFGGALNQYDDLTDPGFIDTHGVFMTKAIQQDMFISEWLMKSEEREMDEAVSQLARDDRIPEHLLQKYWNTKNKDRFGMTDELQKMGLIPRSRRQLRKSKEQEIKTIEAMAQDTYRRATGISALGAFTGSIHAGAIDPPNAIASIATGGLSKGASLLKHVAYGAGTNMAIETALQGQVKSWKSELGIEYSDTEAAMNIGFAGIFGGSIPLATAGIKKMIGVSNGKLMNSIDEGNPSILDRETVNTAVKKYDDELSSRQNDYQQNKDVADNYQREDKELGKNIETQIDEQAKELGITDDVKITKKQAKRALKERVKKERAAKVSSREYAKEQQAIRERTTIEGISVKREQAVGYQKQRLEIEQPEMVHTVVNGVVVTKHPKSARADVVRAGKAPKSGRLAKTEAKRQAKALEKARDENYQAISQLQAKEKQSLKQVEEMQSDLESLKATRRVEKEEYPKRLAQEKAKLRVQEREISAIQTAKQRRIVNEKINALPYPNYEQARAVLDSIDGMKQIQRELNQAPADSAIKPGGFGQAEQLTPKELMYKVDKTIFDIDRTSIADVIPQSQIDDMVNAISLDDKLISNQVAELTEKLSAKTNIEDVEVSIGDRNMKLKEFNEQADELTSKLDKYSKCRGFG